MSESAMLTLPQFHLMVQSASDEAENGYAGTYLYHEAKEPAVASLSGGDEDDYGIANTVQNTGGCYVYILREYLHRLPSYMNRVNGILSGEYEKYGWASWNTIPWVLRDAHGIMFFVKGEGGRVKPFASS